MVMMKNKRKAGVPMEKQRMFKMSQLEQDMLVKALCDTQNDVQPEQAEEMRSLAAKTVPAPRRRLYPVSYTHLALSWRIMRNPSNPL